MLPFLEGSIFKPVSLTSCLNILSFVVNIISIFIILIIIMSEFIIYNIHIHITLISVNQKNYY